MHSININVIQDKKRGDFDSLIWCRMDYDDVREDLLNYYLANQDQIMDLSPSVFEQRLIYKERRDSSVNNCFGYATGLLSCGDYSPDPRLLRKLDISNLSNQRTWFNTAELRQDEGRLLANKYSFFKELAKGQLYPVSELKDVNYREFNPVISLLRPGVDYHFIKPDIYQTPNGPIVLFSHKQGKGYISNDYNLEQFSDNYKQLCENYHYPTIIAAPKSLMNREMNVFQIDNNAKVELHSQRHFKAACNF